MAAYPTIPISNFTEPLPDYAVVRTPLGMGYLQSRPTITVAPRNFKFEHRMMTVAERAIFVTFWNSVKGGGFVFQFTNPNDSVTYNCKFMDDSPDITRVGSAKVFNITVSLMEQL